MGLESAFKSLNIPFVRAKVGDRYVLELLRDRGWECGGENSGHLLCLEKHTTGDGIISALQVLGALKRNDRSLGQFTAELTMFPQILENVRLPSRFNFAVSVPVQAAVRSAEAELAGEGRVLLRASGTESVIRVMVEGRDGALVKRLAGEIASVVKASATA